MSRGIIFALLNATLFVAISCASVGSQLTADIGVTVVEDISDYLKENPQVELLQKLDRQETRDQIRYTFGGHVAGELDSHCLHFSLTHNDILTVCCHLGESLVASDSTSDWWATPHDISLTLNYPKCPNFASAVVTFVEIVANQVNLFLAGKWFRWNSGNSNIFSPGLESW